MEQRDAEKLLGMRKTIFRAGYSGGMAHLASCFSALEIIYTLYMKGILRYDPQNPDLPDRDRFVLSKGHGALALYAVLCEAGCLTENELRSYLKPDCHIGGEPCSRDLKAIEASTGSLGHGLPIAAGMALGQKLDGNGARTFVLIGDGESQEGSVWETAMSAAAMKLDNLIAILDCNGLQKTGRVDETLGAVRWREKWEAFGWNVTEADGHDVDALTRALHECGTEGKPTMVLAHTVKGKGVSIMENNPIWHFRIPNRKEKKIFQDELQISEAEMEA